MYTKPPPENPAKELNTNSTPNSPDHSSVQQTPADETPQVPESAVLVVCHSSEEHQISSDILNVSSQTPVPQLLGDPIEKVYIKKVLPLHHHRTTHQSRSPSRYGSRHYPNLYRTSQRSPRKNEED